MKVFRPQNQVKEWTTSILFVVTAHMILLYSNFVEKDCGVIEFMQNLVPFCYRFIRDRGIMCTAEVLFRTYMNMFLMAGYVMIGKYQKLPDFSVLLNQTCMC